MKGNQKNQQERGAIAPRQRPTIGLVDIFWARSEAIARKWNANQIEFMCGKLRPPGGFEAQANIIAELAGLENVDGLVIWSDYIGHYISPEEIKAFCERYRPLPLVSVGLVEGIPSVAVDNYQGAYEAVNHLIEHHGFRRIACIRGPEGNVEAEERYRAYVDALAGHDIPLEPDLVVTGGFSGPPGMAAVEQLLDGRQAVFEALVAISDEVAFMAIEALQARGIWTPDDVAVVGFDDEGADYTPPLSSVRAPWPAAIEQAVDMLRSLLAGQAVPERVILPSQFVVRQSCGCPSPLIAQIAARPALGVDETFKTAFPVRWDEIQAEIRQAMVAAGDNFDSTWGTQLLDAFEAELEGRTPGRFLLTLERILRQVMAAGGRLTAWHGAISTLRRHVLPTLAHDSQKLTRVENLWQQAQTLIGQSAERAGLVRAAQARQLTNRLHTLGQALITTFDVAELMALLAWELPRLDIPACYLSLYEDPQAPTGWARLMMAYDEQGRIALAADGRRFPARQLVPAGLLPDNRRYDLAVAPLYFQEEQLGFVVFRAGPLEAANYYALSEYMGNLHPLQVYISSALRGALLRQQLHHHALNLENEVAARTQDLLRANEALRLREETARQMQAQLKALQEVSIELSEVDSFDQLCRRAVELGRSRLGFDRLGIWFLDQDPDFIVGSFGVDENGQLRDERQQRLTIDSVGMIKEVLSGKLPLNFRDNTPLYNDNHQLVGQGWHAVAALWDGYKVIGCLFADSLLQRQPPSSYQLELLALYGATLGHLCTRRWATEALRNYSEKLEDMVEERTKALQAAHERLIRQERLAVLGQLAGGVGHELRNPLGVISNAIYFLQMVLPDADETVKEYLDIIAGRVAEAEKMVSDLLNLSRIKPAAKERITISALVAKTLQRHPPPEQVAVATDLASDLPAVFVDAQQIGQVLTNLVTNAYQAIPNSGRVTISAQAEQERVRLSVADTGVGMSPETMEKIFEPLYTTKAKGIGLGLAVSKNLVELNGGSIEVESGEGQGSIFTIVLPIAI
jgi:signal transduction histidine kinase/DNA-binding LacI/PurR family transcriptional regulator